MPMPHEYYRMHDKALNQAVKYIRLSVSPNSVQALTLQVVKHTFKLPLSRLFLPKMPLIFFNK